MRTPRYKKGSPAEEITLYTAVELQIDHGKGPFSAGLSEEPFAGGRADAAVSERSGKGSSPAGWVLLPSSDGHRRWQSYGSNKCQHSADIQSLWLAIWLRKLHTHYLCSQGTCKGQ